ncbi:hypothetical protein SGCOL_002659 [Colletotrichum sp. CLE4]
MLHIVSFQNQERPGAASRRRREGRLVETETITLEGEVPALDHGLLQSPGTESIQDDVESLAFYTNDAERFVHSDMDAEDDGSGVTTCTIGMLALHTTIAAFQPRPFLRKYD